ncbi:MAG: metal-dependent hydrolase [Promethearchaeota archaeon]
MHTNVHYALGVIIASITSYFIPLNLIEYGFILVCSFGVDFDILFSRFEKKDGGNHRNFITHTIYPGAVIFIVGVFIAIFNNYWTVLICGIAYLSHIFLDCVDWGVKLFFTSKYYGWYLLITQDEKNLGIDYKKIINKNMAEDKNFFIKRYYNSNSGIIYLDITISILGFAILFNFTPNLWWVYIGFFLLLEFHLYHKKKAEQS